MREAVSAIDTSDTDTWLNEAGRSLENYETDDSESDGVEFDKPQELVGPEDAAVRPTDGNDPTVAAKDAENLSEDNDANYTNVIESYVVTKTSSDSSIESFVYEPQLTENEMSAIPDAVALEGAPPDNSIGSYANDILVAELGESLDLRPESKPIVGELTLLENYDEPFTLQSGLFGNTSSGSFRSGNARLVEVFEQIETGYDGVSEGFRDEYGYIRRIEHRELSARGEATLYTAISICDLILCRQALLSEGVSAERIDDLVGDLLSTLSQHSWGNSDALGRLFPIRHPDKRDYKKTGEAIRNSPLSKDSFAAIFAACQVVFRDSDVRSDVRGAAKSLAQYWLDYCVLNQWILNPNPILGEYERETIDEKDYYKHIYSEDGGRVSFKGPETFAIAPHEIISVKYAALDMGIPVLANDLWLRPISAELRQTMISIAAPYLARLLADGLRAVLEEIHFGFPYSVTLGSPDWNFGKVEGVFELSVSESDIDNIAGGFESALIHVIREGFRLEHLYSFQSEEVMERALDEVLDLFPENIAGVEWKQVIFSTLSIGFPWLREQALVEIGVYIATLQMMKGIPSIGIGAADPQETNYVFWSYMQICELRPEYTSALKPFLYDYFVFISSQPQNNPSGLWAWLAFEQDQVTRQVDNFRENAIDRWSTLAYENTAYNEWLSRAPDDENRTPRIDHLAIEGLESRGEPPTLEGLIGNWLDTLRWEAGKASVDFVDSITEEFARTGQYAREFVNDAGETISEVWRDGLEYVKRVTVDDVVREILTVRDNGFAELLKFAVSGSFLSRTRWRRVRESLELDPRDIAETLTRHASSALTRVRYLEGGILGELVEWRRSTEAGVAVAEDVAKKLVREADGVLKRWTYAEAQVLTEFVEWRRSTEAGVAVVEDVAKKLVREASGVLKRWTYAEGRVLTEFLEWRRSTEAGVAVAEDVAKKLVREASGVLKRWTYAEGRVLTQFLEWRRSTEAGVAVAEDVAKKLVREANGVLKRWTYAEGRVLTELLEWRRSTEAGAAVAEDVAKKLVREASGVLKRWTYAEGRVLTQFLEWRRSTEAGAAVAEDVAKKLAREASGVLKRWTYAEGRVLTEFLEWRRSTEAGVAVAEDVAKKLVREASGVLKRWTYAEGRVLTEFLEWRRSTEAGVAVAEDVAKKLVREASGVLKRWTYAEGRVLTQFLEWRRSTEAGAAVAEDVAKKLVREASGVLKRWTYAEGRVLTQFLEWRRSTEAGAAVADDVAKKLVRESDGVLKRWTYAEGRVFETFAKWRKSTIRGAAEAIDIAISSTREPSGKLVERVYREGRVLASRGTWIRSELENGYAKAEDMIQKLRRSENGQLEKVIWENSTLKRYLVWKASTPQGAAIAQDLITRVVYDPSGGRIVEAFENGERLARTTYDAAGRVVSHIGDVIRIPNIDLGRLVPRL